MSFLTMLAKIAVFSALLVIGLSVYIRVTTLPVKVPEEYFEDHYWGLKPEVEDVSIKPFKVNVDEKILTDLKERLRNTRFQESLAGSNFEYGFHSSALKSVVDYWLTKYDWRKEEAYLNSFPQFKTQIEGIEVHFIHVKPGREEGKIHVKPEREGEKIHVKQGREGEKKAILLVHSWPGSVIEFYKVIPLLTREGFEVIVPSIPGYGFSEPAHRSGFDVMDTGRVFAKLMTRLNHDTFFYHGGDWGSIVGKALSVLYPERVLGYHSTLPNIHFTLRTLLKILVAEIVSPSLIYTNTTTESGRLHPLSQRIGFVLQETGYFHLQATKPDTSGVGLNDSPAGLAAYILEKFSTWTDPSNRQRRDGGLTMRYSMDDLLTNVMTYWVNGCITSANRMYKEYISVPNFSKLPVSVPVALLLPKHELLLFPPSLLRDIYPDTVHINELHTGGHFSAFEQPALVANDIIAFVNEVSKRKIK